MVSRTSARNATQRIPTIPINVKRVISPFTFYTCPAGKKSIIKGTAVCTGTGAATFVSLLGADELIQKWNNTADIQVTKNINVRTDVIINFEIQLDALEILNYTQDVGTNAEMQINVKVQESPT